MSTANSKVLIVYTGGTIGMVESPAGLVASDDFVALLQQFFAQQPHDCDWSYQALYPALDSAQMTPAHWLTIRDLIVHKSLKEQCSGVLVLHGTDTLAYSAAALSFLLLGFALPVVFTGAMLPASAPQSDAWPNLQTAYRALAGGLNAGVYVAFAGRLLSGVRTMKVSSSACDAFQEHQRPATQAQRTSLPAALNYQVIRRLVSTMVVPMVPGFSAELLQCLIEQSAPDALILECYGSGTACINPAFIRALHMAQERSIFVVGISQCPAGSVVFEQYATGSALHTAGVLSGMGLSREAALGKIFSLLGSALTRSQSRTLLGLDLCGELGA